MQIISDTQTTKDPNVFGEILRNHSFVKKSQYDYGCYSTFELIDGFETVSKDSELGKEMLRHLSYDEDYADNEIDEDVYGLSRIYTNGDITLAWYWDGDGTLCIKEGERVAINDDCKKDHRWQWIKEQ